MQVQDDIPLQKYVAPLTEAAAEEFWAGPQGRKILRLVLPYIPKRQWGKLREVNRTWCSVVDGEWGRMHTIHMTELMERGVDHVGIDQQKGRQLAEHLSSRCQLSRGVLCIPPPHQRRRAVDLTDEEFWCLLLPRTGDLTTIKLHNIWLPKYFYDVFLPKCTNLEVLEIVEAPGAPVDWTDADSRRLDATIDQLNGIKLKYATL